MAASSIAKGQVDLVEFIEWPSLECLNEKNSHTHANALKQGYRDDDGLFLESDADEQLLINLPFMQVVKLHTVIILGPPEEGPKTIKLYVNRQNMGFSNVGDFPASDILTLSPEHLKGKPLSLKYLKFQNVHSLTIFIEDNQESTDVTKINKMAFFGSTVETTNMKELKKVSQDDQ